MDQYYSVADASKNCLIEACFTACVSLFIASKSSDPDPFNLVNLRDFLLHKHFSREQIIKREQEIRHIIAYENDSSYLYDFVMIYFKLACVGLQNNLPACERLVGMEHFLQELQTTIESLAKVVLIDAYCRRYRQSVVAAGIVSTAFELSLQKMLDDHKRFAAQPELVWLPPQYHTQG